MDTSFDFVRVAIGSYSNYQVIHADRMPAVLAQAPSDAFVSLYRFDESYLRFWQEHGNVAGYRGPHAINESLWWDVDCKEELGDALKTTEALGRRLREAGLTPIVWFSGKKGFHVEVRACEFVQGWFNPSPELAAHVREFCLAMTDGLLKTRAIVDDIYTLNHLIRAKWSCRRDGAQKTPVHLTLLGIEALEYDPGEAVRPGNVDPVGLMMHWKEPHTESAPRSHDRVPKSTNVEAILGATVTENRHTALVQYVTILKQRRFPADEALLMARSWNRALPEPIQDESLDRVIHSLYQNSRIRDFDDSSVVDPSSLKLLRDVVPEPWCGNIPTGTMLDYYLAGGLMDGGKAIVVIGASNVGKSLLAQAIAIGAGNSGKRVLFFSLEMSGGELAERSIDALAKDAQVFVVSDMEVSTNDMEQYVQILTREKPLDLIVLDHVGLVSGCEKDRFEHADKVAKGLFSLARQMRITMVEVSHTTEVTDLTIPPPRATRDSRTFLHLADLVLACYRSKDLEWLKVDCYKFRQMIKPNDQCINPLRVGSSFAVKMNEVIKKLKGE